MLTKGSILGGSGDGVASSSIIGAGLSSVFAVPGTSSHATATNNNNIIEMGEFLGLAGGPSSPVIGDSISTFGPQLKDMELRRRARNNAILAKIQELEANACVQAARSDRLRMMREEYENLVRKYAASSRRSHWGTTSNGYLNENNNNNGFPPNRYLQPFNSPQQQLFVSLKEPGPPATQQLLTTTSSTTNAHPFSSSAHPTRDIPSNINPSFATTGVNTDITGPVRPIDPSEDDKEDDLQRALQRRKVTAAIVADSVSQTDIGGGIQKEVETAITAANVQQEQPAASVGVLLPSSSAVPTIYGTRANQGAIVMAREDEKEALLLKPGKRLPTKMEMMLMELDEEEDDDESSFQAERRRKQQLEKFHQQLEQPKAHFRDDTNSISSAPSEVVSTSNPIEEVGLKQRQRQKQQPQQRQLEKVATRKSEKKRNDEEEKENETSQDTTTVSLAKERNKASDKGLVVADGNLSKKILLSEEISLSDSTSAFHTQKNEKERKKLLEKLVTLSATNARNQHKEGLKGIDGAEDQENPFNDDNSDDDLEGKSVMRNDENGTGADICSSPTAGATSESIGDSLMDSIHKTPDALLPRDDYSELHEIEEVAQKEHVVTATAATADTKSPRSTGRSSKPFRVQPGVNDKVSVERKTRLKQEHTFTTATQDGKKEVHEPQINDAEEIRPNNLSSSKVDVPAEVEGNFTHANNPSETNTGITTTTTTSATFQEEGPTFHKDLEEEAEKKDKEEKNSAAATVAFYEDVEHSMDKELMGRKNPEFVDSPFQEKQIVSADSSRNIKGSTIAATMRVNESNRKKSATVTTTTTSAAAMISHSPAPSANMSAHSSTTSSFSSGSNAVENGRANDTLFPPSISAPPPPPSATIHPQRESSTGSSSTSSSRQHSLDEQVPVDGNGTVANSNNISQQTKEQSNSGSHLGSPQLVAGKGTLQQNQQQHKSPTLPQSVHKRHQQLQEQVRKQSEEKETTPPVGADVMPERLSTSSGSVSSAKSGEVLEATSSMIATANNAPSVDINNGTKVSPPEKGAGSGKTTKGSSSSSPAKKTGNAGNSNGNSGGRSNSAARSAKGSGGAGTTKQGGQTGSNITIPSGPTGARNTASRVRLKLHEDSDTDSSEIGLGKTQAAAAASKAGSGQQRQDSSRNTGEANASEKANVEVDDDFDDFYDNF